MRNEKMSIWVWYSDAPHGGYLFEGNPNRDMPPFHIGEILNLLCGEKIVWEHTRKVLEMNMDIAWWNERFPFMRVKPKSIMVEMRPYYRPRKKGKDNE